MDNFEFQPLDKNENTIDEDPITSPPPTSQGFFTKHKTYIIIGIVLVIILIGIGTYYYSYQNPKELTNHEELKNNVNNKELEAFKKSLDNSNDDDDKEDTIREYTKKYNFIESIPDSQIMAANPSMAQMYITAKKIYSNMVNDKVLPDKYDNILLLYIKQLYDSAKNNYNTNTMAAKTTSTTKPKLKPKPKPKEVKKSTEPPAVEINDTKSEASNNSEIKTISLSDLKDLSGD